MYLTCGSEGEVVVERNLIFAIAKCEDMLIMIVYVFGMSGR
jgi:hypothetical protein